MIRVLETGLTQARRLSDVARTARERIAVTLDRFPDSLDVAITIGEVLAELQD